jgi:pimeloyl-ACP methyl ester carboxylesterase
MKLFSTGSGQHRRRLLGALLSGALLLGATGLATTPAASAGGHGPKPTVVLVHGAFADASSWSEVVQRLQRRGYPVIAPANPLRGVPEDTAYLARLLQTISGPIVLVGHSYGGFIITNAATGNPNVKALVYVAAFMPAENDTVQGLQTQFPGTQLGEAALDIRPYPLADGTDGFEAYVKPSLFRGIFAADVPSGVAAVMAATQRPANVDTLGQPSGPPAWESIPAWTLIARNDNLIPAAAQRFMARRAGAHTVEVNASHVAMVSKPDTTANIVIAAANTTVR